MARATLHVCRDRLDVAGFFLDAVHLPWYPRYYCDVDPELEWAVRARCPILFHSLFAQAPTHALIHSLRRIVKVALIRCSRACMSHADPTILLSFDVEAWDRCDGIVAGPLPRCSQQFISLGRRCRLFGIDLPQYLLETPSQHSSLVHLV